MDLQGVNTDLTIAPTDEVPVGEEKIDRELNTKTQSQRLRATLYVLWEQEGKQDSFDDFYRGKMESIIEWIKGKLD